MSLRWQRLKEAARRRWDTCRQARDPVRAAREKQLAEWIAREHKDDPIHK